MKHLDVLSVAEAAKVLQLDPSRVRLLLANGHLEGQKVGGRWLVSGPGVRERQRIPRGGGRRLRPANAWAVLALASGEDAPWVSDKERRRLAGLLAARGLAGLAERLGERARVEHVFAPPRVVRELRAAKRAVPAGAHAPRALGARLVPDQPVDVYVAGHEAPALAREWESSDHPNATIRVLPVGLWPFRERRIPLAAVAVDLAELPDARAQLVGRRLIERLSGAEEETLRQFARLTALRLYAGSVGASTEGE